MATKLRHYIESGLKSANVVRNCESGNALNLGVGSGWVVNIFNYLKNPIGNHKSQLWKLFEKISFPPLKAPPQ